MKQIKLELKESKAVVINDPIYIESGETVEFIVTNPSGELFFSTGDENTKMIEAKFTMSYEQLKSLTKFNIIQKSGGLYPDIFEVTGLKIHDITVIGRTVDERYPDVIQDIYRILGTHGKAIIELYDKHKQKEEEGVIK